DDDLRRAARLEVLLDLIGEMMDVDDRGLDAGGGEAVEHVVDQRLAADGHQRLRHRVGERTHARAEARGEHHGAAGNGGTARFRHQILETNAQVGTLATRIITRSVDAKMTNGKTKWNAGTCAKDVPPAEAYPFA